MSDRTAVIIGAGPAGLTAAFELLERTGYKPVILEATDAIGGISQTVNYKGNRIDIGGHRFFSKSDRVVQWWLDRMPLDPLADAAAGHDRMRSTPYSDDPARLLIRERVSRIYYLRKFFDYPLKLGVATLKNMGLMRTLRIGLSYMRARLLPIKPEKSLEDFFINRFGRELYGTFFKDYTEKVWGIRCSQIRPEWGAQRIKGLSITRALVHALRSLARSKQGGDIHQKEMETSLIERFLYPKFGPGQMWEGVARNVRERGAEIHMGQKVVAIRAEGGRIAEVTTQAPDGTLRSFRGDLFFSTMAVKDLVSCVEPAPEAEVQRVAQGLLYRDFLIVGLLLRKLKLENATTIPTEKKMIPDNWIYIQDPGVVAGRLQIFNNWSPYMVADPENTWIGVEHFCNVGDRLWSMSDEEVARHAIDELAAIGVLDPADILDRTVVRMEKTYPAYFGTYDELDVVRRWADGFDNLYLLGRNGQHRYNNSDHSMLTAMVAVDNIVAGLRDRTNLWQVNTEQEYHESK